MWQKNIKKTIFTLNIGMKYAPELTKFTYPLLHAFASKIGAEVFFITERKFPDWPVTYEKFQIYDLAQKLGSDWNWYLDSDALIHPEMPDITAYLNKNTVCHNGADHANIRWRYDRYFLRDGRHIGSANWCAIASDWCIELWKPLQDMILSEVLNNIRPTVDELNTVITPEHLVDDYVCSRNIAMYGLKFKSITELYREMNFPKYPDGSPVCYFIHHYTRPVPVKVEMVKLALWGGKDEKGLLTKAGEEVTGWNIPESICNIPKE